jgi:hypothetical protein
MASVDSASCKGGDDDVCLVACYLYSTRYPLDGENGSAAQQKNLPLLYAGCDVLRLPEWWRMIYPIFFCGILRGYIFRATFTSSSGDAGRVMGVGDRRRRGRFPACLGDFFWLMGRGFGMKG